MKVILVTKAMHAQNLARGVGAYTRELLHALNRVAPTDTFRMGSLTKKPAHYDILHYPFFEPFFLSLPSHFTRPTVITIHDMIPLKYPAHFPVGWRGRLKWYLQRRRARKAQAIITDSESSKRDICKYVGISPERVYSIPLAPATARTSYKLTPKIRKTYQLPAKYILYVGDINWNKNVVGLIDVFTALKSRDVHLVLVGKVFQDRPDIPEYREIQAHIAQSKKRNQIHTLGYVPSHHLGAIYHAALLYCQPSWDEGFGLPVLEAMKAGCPVVSSSRGSLSEIGGEGVRYIDPADQSAWRETLEKVIASATLRDTLRALGYAQVKKYRWEDTARATRAIYAHVLAQATP